MDSIMPQYADAATGLENIPVDILYMIAEKGQSSPVFAFATSKRLI